MKVEMLKVTPNRTETLYECNGERALTALRSYGVVLCDMCEVNPNWHVCSGAYSVTLFDASAEKYILSYQIHIID